MSNIEGDFCSKNPSSFRDEMGFVFNDKSDIFRAVYKQHHQQFLTFLSSSLYEDLLRRGFIPEVQYDHENDDFFVYKVKKIPFISYPAEWCFEQLKSAALFTLDILELAHTHGYLLKDASSYNIQFIGMSPVFIDHFSFQPINNLNFWPAYLQYCKHFLAPLVSMAYSNAFKPRDFITNLDGLSLNDCVSNLALRYKFKPAYFIHLLLHSKAIKKNEPREYAIKSSIGFNTPEKFVWFIGSLRRAILQTSDHRMKTQWTDYYNFHNYAPAEFLCKEMLLSSYFKMSKFKSVLDLGANNGHFSRLAAEYADFVVSADYDHEAVKQNFIINEKRSIKNVLPLVLDLSNPTPSYGWDSAERISFGSRFHFDCLLALALIHHLKITFQIPFEYIAKFFFGMADKAVVEFIPFDDPQSVIINSTKFSFPYTKSDFEIAFKRYFKIIEITEIDSSGRSFYFFERI